jgi:hypothetical protein
VSDSPRLQTRAERKRDQRERRAQTRAFLVERGLPVARPLDDYDDPSWRLLPGEGRQRRYSEALEALAEGLRPWMGLP